MRDVRLAPPRPVAARPAFTAPPYKYAANHDGYELAAPPAKRPRLDPLAPPCPAPTRRVQYRTPVVIFDLETTGKYTQNARIVQFAGIKRYPNGREEVLCMLINPGGPIPAEATQVHGITDEDVKHRPKWGEVVGDIYRFMRDTPVWVGYNIQGYDVPLLRNELARQGYELPQALHVDAFPMYATVAPKGTRVGSGARQWITPNQKLVTAYRYCTGQELDKAHDALADARGAQVVLDHLVASFPQTFSTVPEELAKYRMLNWRPIKAGA